MLKVGKVEFDVSARQLMCGENSRILEPKVSLLLEILIKANGNVVTRDALIEQVWQGRVVGDGAINRTVSLLRSHFKALDGSQTYVKTLPKTGYQLTVEWEVLPDRAPVDEVEMLSQESTSAELIERDTKTFGLLPIAIAAFLIFLFLFWFYQPTENEEKPGPAITLNKLTALPGIEFNLSVANTGQLLYQHLPEQAGATQVYMQNEPRGPLEKVTALAQKVSSATISPNGKYIAFSSHNNAFCQVSLFSVQSNTTRLLSNCASDSFPIFTWSPDSQFVFFRDRKNKTQPYVVKRVDINSRQTAQLTLPPAGGNIRGDHKLSHHPSKSMLAVVRYLDEKTSLIHIIDSDSGEMISQWNVPYLVQAINWYKGGNALLFSSEKSLYSTDALTTKINLVKEFTTRIQSIAVNGHQVFISELRSSSSVYHYLIDAEQDVQIVASSENEHMPRSNANGQLAFISTRHENPEFWLGTDGQFKKAAFELPFDLTADRFEWSPNGNLILMTKGGRIYQINVKSNKTHELSKSNLQAYVANYHPDGERIIYSSDVSGSWQLWLLDHQNNGSVQLTRNGGYSGRIVDDKLYFTKFNENGLWQLDLSTKIESLLISDVDLINWLNWQLIGDNIYYYVPNEGIRQFNLVSKTNTLIFKSDKNFIHQFSVAADQNAVTYIKQGRLEGDVYYMDLN